MNPPAIVTDELVRKFPLDNGIATPPADGFDVEAHERIGCFAFEFCVRQT